MFYEYARQKYMQQTKFASWNEVLPHIFIGDIFSISDPNLFLKHGVKAVLSCVSTVGYGGLISPDVAHFQLELRDHPSEDLTPYFDEVCEWMHACHTNGRPILVHCHAGRSRSVAMVLAYLLRLTGGRYTTNQLLKLIQKRRPEAGPNEGFMMQLMNQETIISGGRRKNKQTDVGEPDSPP